MKKWYSVVITASLLMSFLIGYHLVRSPINKSNFTSEPIINDTNPLELIYAGVQPLLPTLGNASQVVFAEAIVADFFAQRNLTKEENISLYTWNRLKHLINNTQGLPNAVEAIKEAGVAWKNLVASVEEEKLQSNWSSSKRGKEKQCPHFLSKLNASELDDSGYKLRVPCGLTEGSSITFIGIPNGLVGNFLVDLIGEPIPGEPDPPIILRYNVTLHGDNVTGNPVIAQNTWNLAHDWGEEVRCPSPEKEKNKKVDELDQCNDLIGKEHKTTIKAYRHVNGSEDISTITDGKPRTYFPFRLNELFVATLKISLEGIQMIVDGKHVTSCAYRDTFDPRLIREVRISGDVNLISVEASGLPTSEDLGHIVDFEAIKAVPITPRRKLYLFIGVFSTSNNFNRRMAVRRSWMQYPEIRSGQIAVRFFVGLHINKVINEELWNEARSYGDVQLMPFVDYYSIITWKTIAVCIFGTDVVSAKFIMKTDDDSFVRVDEILSSLRRTNVARGLLYGLINSNTPPGRDLDGKWYISYEEWPDDKYPYFAHGSGYVLSNDIARKVSKKYKKGRLKMFKLEDVAMGIWIADMKKNGLDVKYKMDKRVIDVGCREGYVVAHYQSPRKLLCLWQKIQETKRAICCGAINPYSP